MSKLVGVDIVATCEWCAEPIPPWVRLPARTCSKSCRQKLQRFGVGAALARAAKPMRFGYADPPYPGLARRYYKMPEVDHALLAVELVRDYPDGFALSTSSDALVTVRGFVESALPKSRRHLVRTAAWVRGSRGCVTMYPRDAWEPLIVYGGRGRKTGAGVAWDNVLVSPFGARPRSLKSALIGMKTPAFCEWMFRMLGALRGDELVDLFPGSGVVGRAWRLYNRESDTRRTPTSLAGAERHLRETLKQGRHR